ncbi:hypothetical protein GDO78_007958 [Eleutherodactylus coqui]|uniref:Uncharacterized protein n=1 Tax=Eleutherodactylus coqui TaxID=57060 RepID=A0A8J6FJE7_ELECQ|nr:hypothetical protein GDO78_007958 [Eleutherodactylus coqui]
MKCPEQTNIYYIQAIAKEEHNKGVEGQQLLPGPDAQGSPKTLLPHKTSVLLMTHGRWGRLQILHGDPGTSKYTTDGVGSSSVILQTRLPIGNCINDTYKPLGATLPAECNAPPTPAQHISQC